MTLSKDERHAIVSAAIRVRDAAYAPYSKFLVGASLLGDSGTIYHGCNVENVSYGLTICAERVAITNAISQGERKFRAMALCTSSAGTPCGGCRQVLAEFVGSDFPILITDPTGTVHRVVTLNDLLPDRFELPQTATKPDQTT